jgi:perosamine synthetase
MLPILHSRPCITRQDADAVARVLQSGMIAEGRTVAAFEEAVGAYLGLRGGVATSSGTSALFLALTACGIGPGDEVVIPTYVCRSVRDAVLCTGATPVLCDIGDDWCMTPATVEAVLTTATRAIVLVHPFGIADDAGPICELGIPVIEDCCQALGASDGQSMVGQRGIAAIVSFHATKLLTTGEGGMVLTNDAAMLAKIRRLKTGTANGSDLRWRQPMTDLQAALGLSQLARYDVFLDRRRQIADAYFAGLADLPVRLPTSVRNRSVFFRFPIRIAQDFAKVQAAFEAEGIQVRQGVDALLHWNDSNSANRFPVAEAYYRETLSLPIYPALTDVECDRVITACRKIQESPKAMNHG